MYNLIEYSYNYLKTTGSLWKYCRDEPFININSYYWCFWWSFSASFKYKHIITGQAGNNGTK